MKPARSLVFILPLGLLASIAFTRSGPDSPLALIHATVHTAVGPPLQNATILVAAGKIKDVGVNVSVPAGAETVDLAGKVVIPGLIDIHSHIGTLGLTSDDSNESAMPVGPENMALDALHLDLADWPEAVTGGVTTVVTGPGSGERLGGQSITIKTFGVDLDKRILRDRGEAKMAVNANNLSHESMGQV